MCEAADSDLGLTPSRSERSAQGSQIQQNALALGRQREKHQCVGRGDNLRSGSLQMVELGGRSCEGGCTKEPRLMRGGGGWGVLTCFPYLCGGSWRNRGPSDPLLWTGTRGRGWQERGAEAEWAQWPAHQVLQTPGPSTCHRQDHALPWGAFSSCNHISPPLREGVKGRK